MAEAMERRPSSPSRSRPALLRATVRPRRLTLRRCIGAPVSVAKTGLSARLCAEELVRAEQAGE